MTNKPAMTIEDMAAKGHGVKKCSKCKNIFSFNCFYKNKCQKFGLNAYCKDCTKVVQTEERKNSKAYEERLKKRTLRLKELRKDGRYKERDRVNAAKSRIRFPEKIIARDLLNKAVRSGKLIKPCFCSVCKEPVCSRSLHGHHHNGYEHPLDVLWVCTSCHSKQHNKRYALKEKEPT